MPMSARDVVRSDLTKLDLDIATIDRLAQHDVESLRQLANLSRDTALEIARLVGIDEHKMVDELQPRAERLAR